MSIVGFLLFLVGIGVVVGFVYAAKKLYSSALVDDEIAEQEEIARAAERVNSYRTTRSKSSVQTAEQTLEDFINTRRSGKTTKGD